MQAGAGRGPPQLPGLDHGEAQQPAGAAALLGADLVPDAGHVRELASGLDHFLRQHLLDPFLRPGLCSVCVRVPFVHQLNCKSHNREDRLYQFQFSLKVMPLFFLGGSFEQSL